MTAAAWRESKRYADVDGLAMAYVEQGLGDPIVLLHGNPSSSYEWRQVLPYLDGLGRCLVPDLVGMGDSARLPHSGPGTYRFVEHRGYLDGLLRVLGAEQRVTLVLRDWGTALGLDWAYRHPDAVRGIALMEAFVAPSSWSEWPAEAVALFQTLRSPAGEELVLEQNLVIEHLLPGELIRPLGAENLAEYRRPYLEPGESRRPTLSWPREIPVDGEPRDVHDVITRYAAWLARSAIPKLFVEAVPGAMFPAHRALAASWPATTHVRVDAGHLVPQDAPDAVGSAVADWLRGLGSATPGPAAVES